MANGRHALALSALLAGTALAFARPPDGGPLDPALHDWFESLKIPGTEFQCCSVADCRPADYRMGESGYEAWLDSKWQPIPRERVLVGYTNPVGKGIVCRTLNGTILCFVPSNEI